MSKASEIYQAHATADKEIDEYLNPLIQTLNNLLIGLDTFFNGELIFSHKQGNKGTTKLRDLLYLDNGFWRTNQEVELKKNEGQRLSENKFSPPSRVEFALLAKETLGHPGFYEVKLAGFKENFQIRAGGNNEANALYKFFADKIKEYYKKIPDYFKKYGKHPNSLEELAPLCQGAENLQTNKLSELL